MKLNYPGQSRFMVLSISNAFTSSVFFVPLKLLLSLNAFGFSNMCNNVAVKRLLKNGLIQG